MRNNETASNSSENSQQQVQEAQHGQELGRDQGAEVTDNEVHTEEADQQAQQDQNGSVQSLPSHSDSAGVLLEELDVRETSHVAQESEVHVNEQQLQRSRGSDSSEEQREADTSGQLLLSDQQLQYSSGTGPLDEQEADQGGQPLLTGQQIDLMQHSTEHQQTESEGVKLGEEVPQGESPRSMQLDRGDGVSEESEVSPYKRGSVQNLQQRLEERTHAAGDSLEGEQTLQQQQSAVAEESAPKEGQQGGREQAMESINNLEEEIQLEEQVNEVVDQKLEQQKDERDDAAQMSPQKHHSSVEENPQHDVSNPQDQPEADGAAVDQKDDTVKVVDSHSRTHRQKSTKHSKKQPVPSSVAEPATADTEKPRVPAKRPTELLFDAKTANALQSLCALQVSLISDE